MNRRLSLSAVALAFVVAALVAVLVSTTDGSSSKAQGSAANGSISAKQTPLGNTLTDAHGRVLYLFAPDKPNMSTLSAAGRSVWPPFTSTNRPAATGGAHASEIGAASGESGPAQVTYHGHPLYYFVGDRKAGQTTGQGLNEFGGRWYVLSTAGGAITGTPQAVAANGSSGGASSYGY